MLFLRRSLRLLFLTIYALEGDDAIALFHAHQDNALRAAFIDIDGIDRHPDQHAAVLHQHHVVAVFDNRHTGHQTGLCGQIVVFQTLAAALLSEETEAPSDFLEKLSSEYAQRVESR